MVRKIFERVKKAVIDQYDPDREDRIKRLANHLYKDLVARRDAFTLESSISMLDVSNSDVTAAKRFLYDYLLRKVWADGIVTPKERTDLQWVQNKLQFPSHEAGQLDLEYAKSEFGKAFSLAMDDGELSDEEFARLDELASAVGSNAEQMAKAFFSDEGESFIRSSFLKTIGGGELSNEAWGKLVKTARRLGISRDNLQVVLIRVAKQHIEHVLADAKSDGEICQAEESHLMWLLEIFAVDQEFKAYVQKEIADVGRLNEIAKGRLPSLAPPPEIAIRAGELVHSTCRAELIIVRDLKSGTRRDAFVGMLAVMDSRAVFQGPDKAQIVRFNQLVMLNPRIGLIEFQLNGKPTWYFRINADHWEVPLIFGKAVAMHNQTQVRIVDDAPSRHIPREVRQRVWTLYGGQCVDCGAKDYLEFDHIIPVAKGGSNAESNIQLLCRRCNLKKSDAI